MLAHEPVALRSDGVRLQFDRLLVGLDDVRRKRR
jgi:hypothetical protein